MEPADKLGLERSEKDLFHLKKGFNVSLCSFCNEDILSHSDISVAMVASTLATLGGAIGVFK